MQDLGFLFWDLYWERRRPRLLTYRDCHCSLTSWLAASRRGRRRSQDKDCGFVVKTAVKSFTFLLLSVGLQAQQ